MDTNSSSIRGTIFFWILFLLIAAGIGATVLLANNARNLNHILEITGLTPRQMTIPKPGRVRSFKGKRLGTAEVTLPSHVFDPVALNDIGGFLREIRLEAHTLCSEFEKAGLIDRSWSPGLFSKSVFECSAERTIESPTPGGRPSSFFLIVKGPEKGPLTSMRVKLVIERIEDRQALVTLSTRAIGRVVDLTGFREFATAPMDILSLTPFSIITSGVSLSFSREFSGDGYNLIFSRATRTPAQRRTNAYFNREDHMPIPPARYLATD